MKKLNSTQIVTKSPVREKAARSRHNNRSPDGRFVAGESGLPPECRHQSHGLSAMRRALAEVSQSERWLDDLGDVGTAMRSWRAEIIEDLGGEESISAMQRVLIDSAAKTYVLLSSVDAWLLRQNPINKRTKSLYPIVQQRQQLADALARYMEKLGLERRQRKVPSLKAYLEARSPTDSDE